jgi:hypothetical protein
MSNNHKSTIASTNRSRGSIHFTVCLLRSTKLEARALPKGKLLCLPRDTVGRSRRTCRDLGRLALQGIAYPHGVGTRRFLGKRAAVFRKILGIHPASLTSESRKNDTSFSFLNCQHSELQRSKKPGGSIVCRDRPSRSIAPNYPAQEGTFVRFLGSSQPAAQTQGRRLQHLSARRLC